MDESESKSTQSSLPAGDKTAAEQQPLPSRGITGAGTARPREHLERVEPIEPRASLSTNTDRSAKRDAGQDAGEPRQVKIVLHAGPVKSSQRLVTSSPTVGKSSQSERTLAATRLEGQPIPARMLNEFVYCRRLFYYEFVDGVFVESADTLRGEAIHQRVDSGSGALPAARKKLETGKEQSPDRKGAGLVEQSRAGDQAVSPEAKDAGKEPLPDGRGSAGSIENRKSEIENETIHSRSVQMGSERLGVVAKMDLVEVRAARAAEQSEAGVLAKAAAGETDDLFSALEVCPVDYKAGAPREGAESNELWDTDKMQLGLQALILRDNGYTCNEGIIYYRATKQRVRLAITSELESWVLQNIAEARKTISGPIPPPLVNSPKCVRCSLAPVCLPDETRMLAPVPELPVDDLPDKSDSSEKTSTEPRRLIAARDDTRPLYLNTQGIRVGCKEEVLQVKEKDRVVDEVRLRDLSHVALFGNIQISTQAVQSLCEMEIPVTYFSMGGWFYGITRGHTLKNVFLRMEQFRLARDEASCLSLARQFVYGKIRNHRTMLMRNHLEPPEPVIAKLKRASEDALVAASIEELLGVEGAAASLYFQQFSGMIKIADELAAPGEQDSAAGVKQLAFNFSFTNRNRRPPTDPVNAMLSLAYSLLSKDCTLAALAVGFDPYIGFYHQPRFGRPALALDLMEEMRPIIAESTVLSCINNRVVTEKDFVRAGQAVNLTAPGRKRFFQMYEQRMSSIITHPLFDYKVSYRRALELQARLLAKTLTGEIAEYIPLMTR
ncbi:MAG TPA: CRISPR-associated endonuclease Cas1 [Candidatus Sulfotelmatobacter sp.]|nr:CRISPR-associated endonuclease Cas1 [Candidatus Sulfotelmatobacter sp.]